MLKTENYSLIQKPEKYMENDYKILWTDNTLKELAATYEYLETNFTYTELHHLSKEIEKTTLLIALNRKLFPESELKVVFRK
jgi:hypothetical protein